MNYIECFRTIARHRTNELVVTSAGNSSQAWWEVTRDSEASFYLDASMSLSTMFASGLALARPEQKVWAFMGDGAFCMNPGMLMVEREMNLPNLGEQPADLAEAARTFLREKFLRVKTGEIGRAHV